MSHLSTAAAACGGFAAVCSARRRYRSLAARSALSSNYELCQLTQEAETQTCYGFICLHKTLKDRDVIMRRMCVICTFDGIDVDENLSDDDSGVEQYDAAERELERVAL